MQNLIDLAGSESSRAETTGIRRREGSYINKSLLTLGTVRSQTLLADPIRFSPFYLRYPYLLTKFAQCSVSVRIFFLLCLVIHLSLSLILD